METDETRAFLAAHPEIYWYTNAAGRRVYYIAGQPEESTSPRWLVAGPEDRKTHGRSEGSKQVPLGKAYRPTGWAVALRRKNADGSMVIYTDDVHAAWHGFASVTKHTRLESQASARAVFETLPEILKPICEVYFQNGRQMW
jgi:hypothetical protein